MHAHTVMLPEIKNKRPNVFAPGRFLRNTCVFAQVLFRCAQFRLAQFRLAQFKLASFKPDW